MTKKMAVVSITFMLAMVFLVAPIVPYLPFVPFDYGCPPPF